MYSDGSLKLTGTGATYDYALNGNDSVFKYDENIRSVTVSDGITRIGDYLFFRCENVQSIALPATLTEIGSNVIAQNDTIVGAVAGSLTSLVIPSRVTTIGEKAFRHNAFTELIIPASVRNWGDYAFADCAKLETVRVESSIIGSFAFPGCSSLSTLVISSNVKKFGNNMLTYCSNLETITYEGTIVQWNAIEKPTNWMSSSGENHLWNGYLQRIQCIDGYLEYDAVNYNWNEAKA